MPISSTITKLVAGKISFSKGEQIGMSVLDRNNPRILGSEEVPPRGISFDFGN